MNKKYILISFVVLLLIGTSYLYKLQSPKKPEAPVDYPPSPIELLETVISEEDPDKITMYICCEVLMQADTNSPYSLIQYFEQVKPENLSILQENNQGVVIASELKGLTYSPDAYFFVESVDSTWKLAKIRSLAQNQIMVMAIEEYESFSDTDRAQMSDEMVDSIDAAKLAVKSDKEIIDHFEDNYELFAGVLSQIQKANEVDQSSLSELNLTSVEKSRICGQCYDFLITGVVDNSVGYLYIPDSELVPEIDGTNYIMIRIIRDGWYVYKTT